LADGTALDAVWRELRNVLNTWNAKRTAIASLLAFETTDAATAVLQGFDHGLLERASEFGEPQAQGRTEELLVGYRLDRYDRASRSPGWRCGR
jgi:hypothetical protein